MAGRAENNASLEMKIGIIGNGFVGSALANALTCEVIVADPELNGVRAADLDYKTIGAVFICVPTPVGKDGAVDASIIWKVLEDVPKETLTIIKSTVTPDHLLEMAKERRIVFNPEFLTQRSSKEDFIHCDSLIFGGGTEDCKEAHLIYLDHSKVNGCPWFYTDLMTASMVKYALNCHFAAKVTFMNELHALYTKLGGSWHDLQAILAADSRLGPTHLDVPGPDGFYGWAGSCFTKDTKAFIHFAAEQGAELSVLRAAVKSNSYIRDD